MKLTLLTPTSKLNLCIYIQLTLEEHGFELHWSTHTWIFFTKCLVESMRVEPQRGRADSKVTCGSLTVRGLAPLTPTVFRGQLYLHT